MKVLVIENEIISEVDFDEYDIDSCIQKFGADEYTVKVDVQDFSSQVTISIIDLYSDRIVHYILRKDVVE